MAISTKLSLINQKFEQPTNGTLDLSGTTKLGKAEYLTGMSATYGATTVPDVAFVTGNTANKLDTPIFTGYTAATQTMYNDIQDPTGFINNQNIVVSYNSTNRTITLSAITGTVDYYWNGVKKTLGASWTSPAHDSDSQAWFLYSTDGDNFAWSTAVWEFNHVMVAARPANTSWAIREVHGVMQHSVHEELHRTIGTYRVSGFGFTDGTYELQPDTPVNDDNTPGFEAGVIADEDIETVIAAWGENSYTRLFFTGTGGAVNFQTAQSTIFRLGGTYPAINTWNGTTFNESESSHDKYFNYYVIRIPVAADATSQLYRAVVLQPQFEYDSLAAAQAENPLSINLGAFNNLAPEFVLVERITLHTDSGYTTTGKVRIEALSILTGAKFNQTSTTPGAGTVTAGNVSVTPLSPFTQTNMQTLSDAYAQCFNALDVITDVALTGTTGSYLGTSGRNVCIDATGQIVLGAALTGATNGLTDGGRIVKLGGLLTENTVICGGAGTYNFSIGNNANKMNNICIDADSVVNIIGDDAVVINGNGSIMNFGAVQIGITSGATNFRGLCYSHDYSNNFQPLSIPHVGYVQDYVTGITDGLTERVEALETWSGATETRLEGIEDDIDYISGQTDLKLDITDFATYTGDTDTRISNIETDVSALGAISGITLVSITGVTNGLTKDGNHDAKLGGELEETTILFGSEIFGVNVNTLNLSGGTGGANGVYLDGDLYAVSLAGGDDLVCIDQITGELGTTSLSAFGGITGGTNGIINCGNQNLGLGGALCADTVICGAGFDLSLGSAGSKLDLLNLHTSGNIGITSDNNLVMSLSGGTITTSDLKGLRYTSDYTTTFVDNSLITKLYVDTVAAGLDPKSAVLVATTGETIDLTGGTFGGVIDGVTLSDGDRVLVKNQTLAAQNGIYDYDFGTSTFTRSSDFDGTPVGEVTEGALIPVLSGSTNINSSWILITKDPIVIGTTELEFTKFSQLLDVAAGNGIDIQTVGETKTISVELESSKPGLCFDGGSLKVYLTDNSGLELLSTGLTVSPSIAGNALDWNAGVIDVNVGDISTQLGGVLTGSTNGLTDLNGVVCLGGALTTATTICGTDTNSLTFQDNAITNKRGILYAADYSSTFVARSLVDKGYVTGLTSGLDARLDVIEPIYVTGATNGLSKSGAHLVKLGGNLSENTTICGAGGTYSLTLGAFANKLDALDVYTNGGICLDAGDSCGRLNLAGGIVILSTDVYNLVMSCTTSTMKLGSVFTSNYMGMSGTTVSDFEMLFEIDATNTKGARFIDNRTTPRGLEYDACYHDDYTLRSLVDKEYVDGLVAASGVTASNGLTAVGNDVQLGGVLDANTIISLDDNSLIITGGTEFGLCIGTTDAYLGNYTTQKAVVAVCEAIGNETIEMIIEDNAGDFNSGIYLYPDEVSITTSDNSSGYASEFKIQSCGMFVNSDYTTFAGIQYCADYSDNYTNRSLPDVEYVTNAIAAGVSGITTTAITGATNGLTKSGQDVKLGGPLSEITTIGVSSSDLQITGTTISAAFSNAQAYVCVGTSTCHQKLEMGTCCASLLMYNDLSGATRFSVNCGTLNAEIESQNKVNICGDNGIVLYNTTCLDATPATGTTSDWVLVRDVATGEVKQIDPANLGEDNNKYSYLTITGNTSLCGSDADPMVIYADSSSGSFTINLPTTGNQCQVIKFKDCAGAALTNNVIINAGGGNTIDGSQCAVINTDYGALELHNAGSNKWFALAFVN